MWKKIMIPAAAAAAVFAAPVSAATTLSVQTNNNAGWAVITPNGSTVTPNVLTGSSRNLSWAGGPWLSPAASGNSGVPQGTYQYVYTLAQPGLFGLLTGRLWVDNRLSRIFFNGISSNGVNFADLGENQFSGLGRAISLDVSQFGQISSITFVTRNDGGPAGMSFGERGLNAPPAIPEPGTWMLMILGLGAVGFAMRRRQSTSVRLQFA
jgi:hypothetical protein